MKPWAHNVTAILPERLLHAYVDVMLPPAKRRAVEAALQRNAELRSTVDNWRKQNANLRRLALLESPTPMSPEMSGVVHRLEGRLRRRAPLEILRIAAAVSLLVAGGAGAAIITQEQLRGTDSLPGLAQEAAQAHRALPASPVEAATAGEPAAQAGVVATPAIVPVGAPAEAGEAGRGPTATPAERSGENEQTRPARSEAVTEPEAAAPAPAHKLPQHPADPSRET